MIAVIEQRVTMPVPAPDAKSTFANNAQSAAAIARTDSAPTVLNLVTTVTAKSVRLVANCAQSAIRIFVPPV